MTKEEKAYLRDWLRNHIADRISFIETCKASGLKVNTIEEAIQKLGPSKASIADQTAESMRGLARDVKE